MTNIIMTGGTSGIGLEVAKTLLQQEHVNLLSGYRSNEVAGAINIPLQLENLLQVKSFAQSALLKLGNAKIDVLLCNAAVNYATLDQRTDDGLEMNFGVNHVAHFYLIQLLKPHLADDCKIILTTSGSIDPDKKTLAAPPRHAHVHWLAYPEQDETLTDDTVPAGQRAYAASKMCNLLTAMHIQHMNNQWRGISYDPGVTPGTGLARHASDEIKAMIKLLTNDAIRKEKFPEANTVTDAGNTLANIALGNIIPPAGKYVALRGGNIKFLTPPGLAQDTSLPEKMWQETEALLQNILTATTSTSA